MTNETDTFTITEQLNDVVKALATKHFIGENRLFDKADLEQVGYVRLIEAAKKYDGRTPLLSYLTIMVSFAIKDELRRYDFIPVKKRKLAQLYHQTAEMFSAVHGRNPTAEEYRELTGESLGEAERIRTEAILKGEGELAGTSKEAEPFELIADNRYRQPATAEEEIAESEILQTLDAELDPDGRAILRGLLDGEKLNTLPKRTGVKLQRIKDVMFEIGQRIKELQGAKRRE